MTDSTVVTAAYPGEDVTQMLRRLKKQTDKASLLPDLKKRQFYTKPGERRRLKHAKALAKLRRAAKRQGEWTAGNGSKPGADQ